MITQDDPSQKYPLPEFVFEKMSGSAEDFYCHSIGKVATVAAEGVNTHAANLRYCIQIHASLMEKVFSSLSAEKKVHLFGISFVWPKLHSSYL